MAEHTRPTSRWVIDAERDERGQYVVTRAVPYTPATARPAPAVPTRSPWRQRWGLRQYALAVLGLLVLGLVAGVAWIVYKVIVIVGEFFAWVDAHSEAIFGGVIVALLVALIAGLSGGGSGWGYHWTRCK